MIPLRDNIPSRRMPIVTWLLMAINAVVFIFQIAQPDGGESLIWQYGAIPDRMIEAIGGEGGLVAAFLPLFTFNFMHGGWLHILGNLLYLHIFGDNVEDYLGHVGFLLFYLAAGIGAGVVHSLLNWSSEAPMVGASGAIAGVMGAYFILYPRAKVLTVVPILIFIQIMEIPAVLFLGFWILMQLFSGAGTVGAEGGGVAWWAHIGGFAIGIALLMVVQSRRMKRARAKLATHKRTDNVTWLN